jgi:CubicO group peptidase (beta-lactamase class C family)
MRKPIMMMSAALCGSLVASAPVRAAAQVAQETSPAAAIRAVDAAAADAVSQGVTAGMVIGIAHNGYPAAIRAYGFSDLEHKVPTNPSTVYRIGSITKQFTAAALLLLAEEGKLSIDDPLSKYLPGFPRGTEVTLRHLLTHTSGLRGYLSEEYFAREARLDRTTGETVAYIAALESPYRFDPGTGWRYANSGYELLGAVIEKVSGQPFAKFLKDRILDPVGLSNTSMDDLTEIVPHRARGYDRVQGSAGKFQNATFISMSQAGAAGAMRSTAADLMKWYAALLSGKVVKPRTLSLMFEPARLKDGRLASAGRLPEQQTIPPSKYGLGFELEWQGGRRVIGKSGSISGFNGWAFMYPDQKVSIVILTNTRRTTGVIAPKIADAFFGALNNEPPKRAARAGGLYLKGSKPVSDNPGETHLH